MSISDDHTYYWKLLATGKILNNYFIIARTFDFFDNAPFGGEVGQERPRHSGRSQPLVVYDHSGKAFTKFTYALEEALCDRITSSHSIGPHHAHGQVVRQIDYIVVQSVKERDGNATLIAVPAQAFIVFTGLTCTVTACSYVGEVVRR